MKNNILVTGAAGDTGTHVVSQLLKAGANVRAMVRQEDQRSDALKNSGAEIVVGDLNDFNSVSAALKGMNTAYFVYPLAPGLLEATAYFAQAAREEQLKLVVNVSQRTSLRDAPSHSAQNHWVAERMLDRSGVPVTHLQPTLFMEWLVYFAEDIRDNSRIVTPFGKAKYASISSEDIARVAAAILLDPASHAGKIYPLFGPQELTQYEVAKILSDQVGRTISYIEVEPEAFGQIVSESDSPFNRPFNIQHFIGIAYMFRSGRLEGMNNNVEEITGTKPRSFAEFISERPGLFG
ncbi:NAD-dependent epimerase/dehydratase family protein [Mucilaginibacter celer]|uniref:NAD-dependent epimerase/dehydratase family protein n=2 Tax=Mucilaginibacter celer TaxID=2305508 RepID=A0A494W704_9SPHI|nr:NAD-dependent epimerase/dehydratase family protein [Mucilaginibacter celer]